MFEDGEDEMTTMLDAWFEECVRLLGQNDAWRDDAALIGQEKGRSLSALCSLRFHYTMWKRRTGNATEFAKGKILPINLKLAKYRQSNNNAIGAGNITFIKKIKRYLNNSKADYNPYIQALEQRYKTIQAYYEYLTKEKELQKVNALTFDFYNKRINWLRNRCILNIITSLDYFKFFCTRKLALKYMLRDMIACIYH